MSQDNVNQQIKEDPHQIKQEEPDEDQTNCSTESKKNKIEFNIWVKDQKIESNPPSQRD